MRAYPVLLVIAGVGLTVAGLNLGPVVGWVCAVVLVVGGSVIGWDALQSAGTDRRRAAWLEGQRRPRRLEAREPVQVPSARPTELER